MVDVADLIKQLEHERDTAQEHAALERDLARTLGNLANDHYANLGAALGYGPGEAPTWVALIAQVASLRQELLELRAKTESKEVLVPREDFDSAVQTVAEMHAAAVGEVRGPIRGVVEDVTDLRQALEEAQAKIQEHREARSAIFEQLAEWRFVVAGLLGWEHGLPMPDDTALQEAVEQIFGSRERLKAQIDRLADFILLEVPGEPSQSEGAVEVAIRLIRAAQNAD